MDDNRGVANGVHPVKLALKRAWPPMSQAKLARRLDMNASTLGLYLNGKGTPPEGFYAAVALILNCDPADLRPTETVAEPVAA
jgi:transcriptional regulator with XRE-family HTH domain